jgi:predicted nucleic-acid-binding protein
VADGRFTFEERHRVAAALDLFQRRKGDLADHLLGLRGEGAGARTTFTFDRDLEGEPRFTVLRG